jgi:hypothetical protein
VRELRADHPSELDAVRPRHHEVHHGDVERPAGHQLVLSDCGADGFVPTPFDLTELAFFLRGKLATVQPGGDTDAG